MSRVRSQITALDGVRDSIDASSAAKDKSTVTDTVLQTFVLANGFIVERRFKDREIKFHNMTNHERDFSEQCECVKWQERSPEQSVELHEPDTTNHLEATKSSVRRLDSLSAYRNVDAGLLPVIEDAPLRVTSVQTKLEVASHGCSDCTPNKLDFVSSVGSFFLG